MNDTSYVKNYQLEIQASPDLPGFLEAREELQLSRRFVSINPAFTVSDDLAHRGTFFFSLQLQDLPNVCSGKRNHGTNLAALLLMPKVLQKFS